jgi:hypothetical protein
MLLLLPEHIILCFYLKSLSIQRLNSPSLVLMHLPQHLVIIVELAIVTAKLLVIIIVVKMELVKHSD